MVKKIDVFDVNLQFYVPTQCYYSMFMSYNFYNYFILLFLPGYFTKHNNFQSVNRYIYDL